MLDVYTVSFFGRRNLPNMFAMEDKLISILRDLINSKKYVEFLVGRDGDFDQLCSSTIRKAIEHYAYGNASHILVLPYERADYRDNRKSFEQYYDEVQISYEASQAFPHLQAAGQRACQRSKRPVICQAFRPPAPPAQHPQQEKAYP